MTDRITEIDRKLKIAKSLTVASVSKSLKHVPRSVIKRSLERVKSHLINKFESEKLELLMSHAIFTRTPRRTSSHRIGDARHVYRQRNVSSATTLVNTLVNKSSRKSKFF
jgi:hypothetical protein